jgi:Tol biopolymer transport system component
VLDFASGELARLTFDDALDSLDAWSPDSRWIYFSSTRGDIAGMNDIYRVSADGGTPMSVSADRYTNEFYASPAPDNTTIAFNARGISSAQWWRRGSSHLDQSELHLMRDINGSAPAQTKYAAVSDAGARESWAMWSRDGRQLYYVSDRTGSQNLWTRNVESGSVKGTGAARQLTRFQDGRVLFPSISADNRTIVFERDFRIWRFDTRGGEAAPIAITRRGAPATPATERLRLTDGIQELALSPDGKKIAFVVRGEVFAASSKEGGDAVRVTNTPAYEAQIAWSPDSERLAYVSNRNGTAQIFIYNLRTNTEAQLTSANINDAAPRYSPDGTMIAFERGGRELRVVNVASKSERVLATGNLHRQPFISDAPFAWSPDNRWIAYTDVGDRLFRNVRVARVDANSSASAAATQALSFLANVGGNTVTWSPDGTFLLYSTGQRTESGGLARIDLIPRTPQFREDQFRDLFREETPRTVTPGTPQQEPTPTTTPTQTPTPSQTPHRRPRRRPKSRLQPCPRHSRRLHRPTRPAHCSPRRAIEQQARSLPSSPCK